MSGDPTLVSVIKIRFGESSVSAMQTTADDILTLWVKSDLIKDLLKYLKTEIIQPFRMLYDLTAIDERRRLKRLNQPESDFTIVYHLTSFDRNQDIRIKVPLKGEYPSVQSITEIWPSADWYEREIFDMFGIQFSGHPNLKRIYMWDDFEGYPMRKDYVIESHEQRAIMRVRKEGE